MTAPLILTLPSKGRLKEQVEAWLADCGLSLTLAGGARGYLAELGGFPDLQVRLLSAADIAAALAAGEAHLGVTGQDLLGEQAGAAERVLTLIPLEFGRADLVVAVPQSWLDVEGMADLEEVAHDILARTGRRMRVATKYALQTRDFLAAHGVDYRMVLSGGSTEGAPAAGAAEIIVDIATSGATLAANGLKRLDDGLILRSQAGLVASLRADWSAPQRAAAERLLRIVEARARARATSLLSWSNDLDAAADPVVASPIADGAQRRGPALLLPDGRSLDVALDLAAAGVSPVSASRPVSIFHAESPAGARLNRALPII